MSPPSTPTCSAFAVRPFLFVSPLSDFIKEYQLDCPYAMDRLVKYGVPATVLHRQVDERDQIGRARQAAETVSALTETPTVVEHGCLASTSEKALPVAHESKDAIAPNECPLSAPLTRAHAPERAERLSSVSASTGQRRRRGGEKGVPQVFHDWYCLRHVGCQFARPVPVTNLEGYLLNYA